MPFTFSHPAIVLPFLKTKNFSATGLIVGSMSPDFEYFIRMKVQSNISHTFLGLLVFNLPMGLLAAFLFHEIIKTNLIENSPSFLQNRLVLLKHLKWTHYFKENYFYVIISILIGAISHIFWDAFTHQSGYFVQKIPFLLFEINNIPFYKIAQHLSSFIGISLIFYYTYKLPVKETIISKPSLNYWFKVLVLIVVFMLIRFSFGLTLNQIGNTVVSFISSIIAALIISGLLFNSKKII